MIMPDQVVQSTPPTTPTSPAAVVPHSSNKTALYVVLVVLLLALVGVGSYFLGQQSGKQTTQPAYTVTIPTTVPVSPTPDETANWKTFSSTKKSYTFKYPSSWTVQEDDYLNLTEVAIPNALISITISEGPYPFGFGDPNTKFEEKNITLTIDGKQYSTKEVIVNNSSAYVNLKLNTEKNEHILFGAPNNAGSLNDYNNNKETILKLLSTFTFTK